MSARVTYAAVRLEAAVGGAPAVTAYCPHHHRSVSAAVTCAVRHGEGWGVWPTVPTTDLAIYAPDGK